MINFYNILKDILLKQSGGTLYKESNFKSECRPFMLARYFSMKEELISYANKLNEMNKVNVLNEKQIYLWCYYHVPKQSTGYIKYISKPKKKKD